MAEKFFSLPGAELRLMFHVKHSAAKAEPALSSSAPTLLVVAGGRAPALSWLRTVSAQKAVYAADRGAACCLAAGVVPRELFGDCDSTTPEVYAQAQQAGTLVHSFNPAKDDTDLQLLLQQLPAGDIIASGIWAGRFDHLYSNVYTLLGVKQQRACQVLLADDKELMLLLTAEEAVELELSTQAEAISLLPLSAESIVDLTGVRWPLAQAVLKQLYPYAISNELADGSKKISCCCEQGALGLYIKFSD